MVRKIMPVKKFTFYSLILLMMIPVTLRATDVSAIIRNVKETQAKIKNVEAFYTQTTHSIMLGATPVVEEGKLYRQGDNVRKEIQSLPQRLIITTPAYQYEKNVATGMEIRRKPVEPEANDPNAIKGKSIIELLDEFQWHIASETDAQVVMVTKAGTSDIRLTVDKRTFSPLQMTVATTQKEVISTMRVEFQYTTVDNLPVTNLMKTTLVVKGPSFSQTMTSVQELKDIKVNQDLAATLFTAPSIE